MRTGGEITNAFELCQGGGVSSERGLSSFENDHHPLNYVGKISFDTACCMIANRLLCFQKHIMHSIESTSAPSAECEAESRKN